LWGKKKPPDDEHLTSKELAEKATDLIDKAYDFMNDINAILDERGKGAK
jgi:hypothetical protein